MENDIYLCRWSSSLLTSVCYTFSCTGNNTDPGILPRSLDVLFNSVEAQLDESGRFQPNMFSSVIRLSEDDIARGVKVSCLYTADWLIVPAKFKGMREWFRWITVGMNVYQPFSIEVSFANGLFCFRKKETWWWWAPTQRRQPAIPPTQQSTLPSARKPRFSVVI